MMTDQPLSDKQASAIDSEQVNWDDTLALLSKRIEKNPNDAASWTNRGILLKNIGDYDGAVRDFEEALRLDRNFGHALCAIGSLYEVLGKHSEAIATFNKAIDLAPCDASNYCDRGGVYLEKGQALEAISDFTKAVELNPNWSMPYFKRAQARSRKDIRDFAGALSDYDAFFQLEHKCTEIIALAHGLRAFLFIELGRYKDAISDFNAKLALTPGNAADYLTRSKLYKMLGEMIRAKEDYRKALELDPLIVSNR